MPSPIPALYVPTAAARAAARKAFGERNLWCCGNQRASQDDWSNWEAYYGQSHHWMIHDGGASQHWQMQSNGPVDGFKSDYTRVNSVAHFVSAVRARRATK